MLIVIMVAVNDGFLGPTYLTCLVTVRVTVFKLVCCWCCGITEK